MNGTSYLGKRVLGNASDELLPGKIDVKNITTNGVLIESVSGDSVKTKKINPGLYCVEVAGAGGGDGGNGNNAGEEGRSGGYAKLYFYVPMPVDALLISGSAGKTGGSLAGGNMVGGGGGGGGAGSLFVISILNIYVAASGGRGGDGGDSGNSTTTGGSGGAGSFRSGSYGQNGDKQSGASQTPGLGGSSGTSKSFFYGVSVSGCNNIDMESENGPAHGEDGYVKLYKIYSL
jgi:hypothetical protein